MENRINKAIRSQSVRLIAEDGTAIGIVPLKEALNKAQEVGLDLVEVHVDPKASVCKLMDYGKYKYEQRKKEKESRKSAKTIENKEIRLRPNIGQADLDTKTNQILSFLKDGARVKIQVQFRGREMSHMKLGKEVMDQIVVKVGELGKIEVAPKVEGRNMLMVLMPNN